MLGHSISKKTAAKAITTGALGAVAGGLIFEGKNVGYPCTKPAKIAVVAGVMEVSGNVTYDFYKKGGIL